MASFTLSSRSTGFPLFPSGKPLATSWTLSNWIRRGTDTQPFLAGDTRPFLLRLSGRTYTPQELQAPQSGRRVTIQADHPQKFKPAAFILSEIFHPQHLAHFPKIALIAACDRLVMRGSLLSDAVRIALIQVVSFSVTGSPKISISAVAAVRPIACSKASRIR